MYFKRLEMHGFKSFAEPVSLEFVEGMTCVVGPNGSGKSNIADAIKWVLGEQSPKNLRGGKMEEVIFAGTENRKARGIAEVTLVIDNKDQLLPIEFNEVAITRRMYRSGESEYLINNRPCRLKDIRELIMDTGIGVEGYSLIGQGKISDIVNNRAEGRRVLFEEAAGIVKYRTRKNEAERKLSNASSNLDRVNDIIKEIEGRIDGLKDDSVKAKEYIVLRDRFKILEINLAVRQLDTMEDRINSMKEELTSIENDIIQSERSREEAEQEMLRIREAEKELESELEEKRNSLVIESEKINRFKNNIDVSEEKLSSIDNEFKRLGEEIFRDELKIKEEKSGLDFIVEYINQLKNKINDKEELISEREKDFSDVSFKTLSKLEDIDKKRNAVFDLHSGINVSKSEINGLNSLIDGLTVRLNKIEEDINSSELSIEDMKRQIQKAQNELNRKNEEIHEYKSLLEKNIENAQEQKNEIDTISLHTAKIEDRIHKAVTKRDLLIGFENSYEGYGQAVKFIMSRRNHIPGIHGVATDLINVPQGYEIAIQTALGGSIQNIICEDDKAAKAGIQALKEEKGGRATFLPFKTIRGGRNAAKSKNAADMRNEKGFLGFAVELIDFDDKYYSVMEYLLGRTVIADKLENALSLSKRYTEGVRFVTLDGDDINPSGAITGGKVKNSAPNLFERKNEIKKLDNEISKLRKENQEQTVVLNDKKQKFSELLSTKEDYSLKIREGENEILRLKGNIETVSSRKSIVVNNISRWNKESDDIKREMAETGKLVENLQGDVDKKLSEIAKSEVYVDDETKAYEESKAKADEVQSTINTLKIELSSLKSDLRHSEDNLERTQNNLKNLESEIQSRENEKNSKEEEKKSAYTLIDESKVSLERAQKEYNNIKLEEDDIKDRKAAAAVKIQELEELKKEIEANANRVIVQKHDYELKITKNETQIESIINRLWESFDVTPVEAKSMRLESFVISAATKESREIKVRMQELEPVNIGAIEEYRQVSERYEFMTEQREDLNTSIDALNGIIVDMDKQIQSRFLISFEQISKEFKKTFTELFDGGHAELKLENQENVLESVIEIVAQPPGKKLQNITLLSGGEKTLTAIALLCSILKIKPTPFCILDEVDAALDDFNTGQFVDYLYRGYKNVQFIVVTHQKVTMEKADAMYGITMPEKGVSKVVSLRMKQDSN